LAAQFTAANREFIALLVRATPEQWRTRTIDEGELRSVGVIAYHVAEAHGRIARRVQAIAAGQPVPARHPEQFDARNAQEARDNPDPDQAATIQRLQDSGDEIARLIAALSDAELDRAGAEDPDAPALTTRQVIELRQIGHVRSHLGTIGTVLRK
jgi:hypothetical protein